MGVFAFPLKEEIHVQRVRAHAVVQQIRKGGLGRVAEGAQALHERLGPGGCVVPVLFLFRLRLCRPERHERLALFPLWLRTASATPGVSSRATISSRCEVFSVS